MIFFPEDLTLFFGVRTAEQEAKGCFSKSGFWLREVPLGKEERLSRREVQNKLLNLVPFIYPERLARFGAFFGIQF